MVEQFIFYIHSEIFNPDNFKDENINTFAKSMNNVFEIARQLNAKVFYKFGDVQTLESFFDDDYGFTQSQGNRLDVLLRDFKSFKEDYHFFKVLFEKEQTSFRYLESYGFLDAMDNQKANYIVFTQNSSGKEQLLLVHASHDFYFCEINNFNVAQDIWSFINEQLPPRIYSFSPKHGNATIKKNPPKNPDKVAQLRCSNEKAQEWLNTAIFDLRESSFYYNFDTDHDTYIIFPYEGDTPQNQYHAFHIIQQEWEKEIPSSIRKHFDK